MKFTSHFITPVIQKPASKFKLSRTIPLLSLSIVKQNNDNIALCNLRHLVINNQVKKINLGIGHIFHIGSNKLDGTFQKEIFKQLETIVSSPRFAKSPLFLSENIHLYIVSHGIHSGANIAGDLIYMMDYVIVLSEDIIHFVGRDHEWSNNPEKESESKLYDLVLPREFTLEYLKDLVTCRDIIE